MKMSYKIKLVRNFVDALMCYKQKCKVVSLNLAHPVQFKTIQTFSMKKLN